MIEIDYLVTKRRIKKADRLIIKVHGQFNNDWKLKKFVYTVLINEDGKAVIDKIKIDSNDSSLLKTIKQDKNVKEAIRQQIIVWNLVKEMEQSKEDDIVIIQERFEGNVNVFSIEFMLKNVPYANFEMNFYKNEERLPIILYNYAKEINLRGFIEKRLEEKAREKLCKQILMQSAQRVKLIANGYRLV